MSFATPFLQTLESCSAVIWPQQALLQPNPDTRAGHAGKCGSSVHCVRQAECVACLGVGIGVQSWIKKKHKTQGCLKTTEGCLNIVITFNHYIPFNKPSRMRSVGLTP